MTAVDTEKQSLTPPGAVTLWTLDASAIGGTVVRFCAQNESDAAVAFDGLSFVPLPIRATGFSRTTRGAQARPEIEIMDPSRLVLGMMATTNGLRGAKVTRTRTFRNHLDDGTDPDTGAVWPSEIYFVNRRMASDSRVSVRFELANSLDQASVQLPAGVALKGFCDFIYRRFDTATAAFVIDDHDPCPYAGTPMFDAAGNVVTASADDICGKRLSDCKKRFGSTAALPYRGFPGMRKFS